MLLTPHGRPSQAMAPLTTAPPLPSWSSLMPCPATPLPGLLGCTDQHWQPLRCPCQHTATGSGCPCLSRDRRQDPAISRAPFPPQQSLPYTYAAPCTSLPLQSAPHLLLKHTEGLLHLSLHTATQDRLLSPSNSCPAALMFSSCSHLWKQPSVRAGHPCHSPVLTAQWHSYCCPLWHRHRFPGAGTRHSGGAQPQPPGKRHCFCWMGRSDGGIRELLKDGSFYTGLNWELLGANSIFPNSRNILFFPKASFVSTAIAKYWRQRFTQCTQLIQHQATSKRWRHWFF